MRCSQQREPDGQQQSAGECWHERPDGEPLRGTVEVEDHGADQPAPDHQTKEGDRLWE